MVADLFQMLDAYAFYLIVITLAVALRLYALVCIQRSKQRHPSSYR